MTTSMLRLGSERTSVDFERLCSRGSTQLTTRRNATYGSDWQRRCYMAS